MSSVVSLIGSWPGKSAVDPGGQTHPAVWHMLDVAAVAEELLAPFDLPPARRDALAYLAALHDLGKIGAQFRAMLLGQGAQAWLHWQVSEAHLLANSDWLCQRLEVGRRALAQM
jgi:CRISPR-associated endonuclease/helicase Cas3